MPAPQPVVIRGRLVRLEPLARRHAADLLAVGHDEEIWRYLPRPALRDVADAERWIDEAVGATAAGREVAFAIVDNAAAAAIGSTRYLDIRCADRGIEIGWTWLGRRFQRTGANTECKYLLLRHAFETLGAIRVQLKTDGRNARSQRAIERIGGVPEGVLRRQRAMWDGVVRDTVYYSILDSEWPDAKRRLEALLGPAPADG